MDGGAALPHAEYGIQDGTIIDKLVDTTVRNRPPVWPARQVDGSSAQPSPERDLPSAHPVASEKVALTPAAVPFPETRASVLLDLLRGIAAVLVLLDHWRNMLFVDYRALQGHRILAAIPYLLTSAGHQAVVVFFVLSGYLVGGSVWRSLDRGTWNWVNYLSHRLVRLWIVLLPGLLLCLLWDQVGLRLHHAPLLYGGANYNHLTPAVQPGLTPLAFFGNLCFVGGLHVPIFGSDGALWSLAFEFWYYLLFPLALLLIRRQTSVPRRAVLLGLLLACALVAGREVLISFPIWLLGAWLARARRPQPGSFFRRSIVFLYPLLFFGGSKLHLIPGVGQDYGLALATAALLVVLLQQTQPAKAGEVGVRLARPLAGFSFTLYVAHLPFMLLLTSVLAGDGRWQPVGAALPLGIAVLALTLLYSYGLAAVTERHTERVRKTIEGWLRFSRSPTLGPVSTSRWIGGKSATVHETVQ